MEYKVKEVLGKDLRVGDYIWNDKFHKFSPHTEASIQQLSDLPELDLLNTPFLVRLETKDKVSPVSYKDFQFKAYIPSLEITLDRLALYPGGNIGVDADYFSAILKESPLKLEWHGDEEVYQYDEKEEAYSTVALSVLCGDDWLWIEPSDYELLTEYHNSTPDVNGEMLEALKGISESFTDFISHSGIVSGDSYDKAITDILSVERLIKSVLSKPMAEKIKLPKKMKLECHYTKGELHFTEGFNNCLNKIKESNNL